MTNEQKIKILKEIEVMLEGHFLLTSGRHSDKYMQCAKLFQYPKYAEMFAKDLCENFRNDKIDVVVGPAVGGIILAYEVSRQLDVKNVFAERENGEMCLRRGFEVLPGQNVLIVEDVVTTGGSVKEVISLMKELGANILGVGSVVDRSAGKTDFGYPFFAVLSMEVKSYAPEECPICKKNLPLVKPGSRNLK
ncbi:MAG: orotate phosphoribosyltransferase [Eubacteriales bacterium]